MQQKCFITIFWGKDLNRPSLVINNSDYLDNYNLLLFHHRFSFNYIPKHLLKNKD